MKELFFSIYIHSTFLIMDRDRKFNFLKATQIFENQLVFGKSKECLLKKSLI